MTRKMYDAVTVANLPADGDLYLAYVDGAFANVAAVRARFPNKPVLTITVTGRPGAQLCDCENGDLSPASAVTWAWTEHRAGRHPTIYANASTWAQIKALLDVKGMALGRELEGMVAQYDGVAEIPEGFVAKQYLGSPGNSPGPYDVSAVADHWPGVDPAPQQEESIMATDTDRGGLVRLAYLSVHGREPTPQEWALGKLVLAQSDNLDAFVSSVADSASGHAAEAARSPQP